MKTLVILALSLACGCATREELADVRRDACADNNDLWERVGDLERTVRDMRRGYCVVPMHVTITNVMGRTRDWILE